jgi:hypothetical protein
MPVQAGNSILSQKEKNMFEERRRFLKTTLGAGVAGISTLLAAKYSIAKKPAKSANGVVKGQSPKKEVLYRKTADWETYYNAAY